MSLRPPGSSSRVLNQDLELAGDRQFATTLARGLHLLKCFSPDRPELANKDFCQLLGLPKSTISRLTYTLCLLGYLHQSDNSTRFTLGSATLSLGYPLLANLALRQEARPAMNALADFARASVSMGIRDRNNIVFFETSRSRRARSTRTADIGMSYPIAASSLGWAWLAAISSEERGATLNAIRLKEPDLWQQYQKSMQDGLRQMRDNGFCVSYGGLRPEIVTVGAAYPEPVDGRVVVFNCAMHVSDCTPEYAQVEVGPRLLNMLAQLAKRGGTQG
jgi:DNA-binding IclR family transcriptional regulator